MAYNPNDGIEIRWGAPENSNERATCHRHAPAKQLETMRSVRTWFSKRLHPRHTCTALRALPQWGRKSRNGKVFSPLPGEMSRSDRGGSGTQEFLLYFLFRKKYTGIPEKIKIKPIAASRGLVIMVLKNRPIQNRMNMAGTMG